jgi:diadenylate cyclase
MAFPPELLAALELVVPGQPLRAGIDRVLQAKMGALIIVGDGPEVLAICSGGFLLDAEYSRQRLSELAKMDGAIILSNDASRIARANVHLLPDPSAPTQETGTRHRTAERVARSVGVPVIAVSEEMSVITIYCGEHRHQVDPIGRIADRASQALQTLERYRQRLDAVTSQLSLHEVDDLVTVRDVIAVAQRAEMLRRLSDEITAVAIELGSEGRLVGLQLEELLEGVDRELTLLLRDYLSPDSSEASIERGRKALGHLSTPELVDPEEVAIALGLRDDERRMRPMQAAIHPRGYRLLSRIPRLSDHVIENVVQEFGSLSALREATTADLTNVDGVGEVRARAILEGLSRVMEGVTLEARIR